jgi:hypothetical protein
MMGLISSRRTKGTAIKGLIVDGWNIVSPPFRYCWLYLEKIRCVWLEVLRAWDKFLVSFEQIYLPNWIFLFRSSINKLVCKSVCMWTKLSPRSTEPWVSMQIFKSRFPDALFIFDLWLAYMLKQHSSGSSDLTARSSAVANKGCWNTHSVSHSPAAARGQVNSEHKLRLHNGAVRACCIKHNISAQTSRSEMPCWIYFTTSEMHSSLLSVEGCYYFWQLWQTHSNTLLCSMSQRLRMVPHKKHSIHVYVRILLVWFSQNLKYWSDFIVSMFLISH